MENVVLTIHLILALSLVGIVLLQRSEGGGLGMGGGGDAMSGRAAANALTKTTWILAVGFIITSLSLTVIAAEKSAGSSIFDRLGVSEPAASTAPELPNVDDLLPPTIGNTAPLVPSAD